MAQILIVEDNTDIATLYQRALMFHQHTLASSAERALEILLEKSFDLVILDMHLPEKPGIVVLDYIRHSEKHKSTKVFAISADDLMREECRKLGIEAWMTKPIEVDELITKVMSLVAPQQSAGLD